MRYLRSVVPTLGIRLLPAGVHYFAALIVARLEPEAFDQLEGLVVRATLDGGALTVEFFDGETMRLDLDGLTAGRERSARG